MKKRVVITGGHLTPALAVIEELQKQGGWEIFFLGRKYAAEGDKTPSLESEIIPSKGINFIVFNPGRVQGKFTPYTIPAAFRIPLGFLEALYYLISLRPKLILSFGGYVSVPVVVAGWFLRIPSLTHEQTTVLGLATKINSFFAKKIAVSWSTTLRYLPKDKVVLTGNPVRKEIFEIDKHYWRLLGFDENLPLILVTGGNQGSHILNIAIESILERILSKYNLFHQTGHLGGFKDYERLNKKRNTLSSRIKKRYQIQKYVSGREWSTIINKADLVISRAGINTLTELCALQKPMLLIPIPWLYGNEQGKNAIMLKKLGIAEAILQEGLTPQVLLKMIEKMIADLDYYRQNFPKVKNLIILNAAQKIADLAASLT